MSNPNFPIRKFTREEASKGGKTSTIYKTLSMTLAKREKCTTSCRFFEQCPVNALSYGYKSKDHPEQNQKCLMKEFPHTVRQQFINLFLTGEEGVIHGIKTALHNYMVDVEAYGNLHDKRDMVQLMLQFYKEVYNTQRQKGLKKEPLTITIRRVGMAPETMEFNPRSALPEGVTAKEIMFDGNEDITEGDPESLMLSPIMDNFIRGKPIPRPIYMEEIKIESNIEQILEEEDG